MKSQRRIENEKIFSESAGDNIGLSVSRKNVHTGMVNIRWALGCVNCTFPRSEEAPQPRACCFTIPSLVGYRIQNLGMLRPARIWTTRYRAWSAATCSSSTGSSARTTLAAAGGGGGATGGAGRTAAGPSCTGSISRD